MARRWLAATCVAIIRSSPEHATDSCRINDNERGENAAHRILVGVTEFGARVRRRDADGKVR